jgi:hypothetical protein
MLAVSSLSTNGYHSRVRLQKKIFWINLKGLFKLRILCLIVNNIFRRNYHPNNTEATEPYQLYQC